MKHPLIIYIIACLWCWGTLAPLRGVPLWVLLSGESADASGPTSPGTADVIAWWDLDNNGNDSSANARNLSTQGAVSYTTAKVGTHSLLLDVTNEWLFIADAAWMTPAGAFSICGWYRPTDATPTFDEGILSHQGSTNAERGWSIRKRTTGITRFSVFYNSGVNGVTVDSTSTAVDNTWYFWAGVFEPSTSIKIYINGALEGTNTTSIPAAVTNAASPQLRLGSYNNESTNSSLGRHDSVGFFNKALTAGEITWLYNSGNGRAYSDL